MILIDQTNNGYIVTVKYRTTGDEPEPDEVMVFEESDNVETQHDLHCALRMLYHVIEQLGIYGSKHDAERLRVEVVKREE